MTKPLTKIQWLYSASAYDGDDCLYWSPWQTDRRPRISIDGIESNASRVMCIIAHGDPPTPIHHGAHSCGNGWGGCLNPRHLRWATSKENAEDKIKHGTSCKGEANSQAKLTELQVLAICERFKVLRNKAAVGREFGVSEDQIRMIVKGRKWAWLTGITEPIG